MAEAVYHQSSFIGGEWSKLAQGRSDLDAYKTALNVNLNGISTIEGAWVRRSGTMYVGPTSDREYAKLVGVNTAGSYSIVMVFGNERLRYLSDQQWLATLPFLHVTASSSSTGTLSLTTSATHGWSVGDMVFIEWQTGVSAAAGLYFNKLMKIITTPASDQITVADDLGNTFDFDSTSNAVAGCVIKRVWEFTLAGWTASVLPNVRVVQAGEHVVMLCPGLFPKDQRVYLDTSFRINFGSLTDFDFRDGPYLDPQETAPGVSETGTVSAYTGTITFTPSASSFDADDVGRHIRLYHEPAPWDSGTTYAYGDFATYQGKWWVSIAAGAYASSNVGIVPGTFGTVSGTTVVLWAPAPEAGRWAWGKIATQSGSACTVILETDLNSANGTVVSEWRLGVYKIGQYPTCGTYHDGRLFLAGAVPNIVDCSKSNDPTNFAPTDETGAVSDDNAVHLVLNFASQVRVRWMTSDDRGVLVGSEDSEILISADGGITPYDREAKPMTAYKTADIEPIRIGTALVFAQFHQRLFVEYKPASFSTRFEGVYLNEFSQHHTKGLIEGIAYQQTPVPVLWYFDALGGLYGITYRRQDANLIAGAHQHELAGGTRLVASMAVGTKTAGGSDRLYLCTLSGDGDDYAIEIMQPLLSEAA